MTEPLPDFTARVDSNGDEWLDDGARFYAAMSLLWIGEHGPEMVRRDEDGKLHWIADS